MKTEYTGQMNMYLNYYNTDINNKYDIPNKEQLLNESEKVINE